eukprot:TRINITY_DN634_c1_g1_i1.p1 TRINITY_DN634_c1_g1~~TRINITY_DN634_c1_g1_i1.p1  ORF type:complete len:336 (-),score=69.96 TRINITY_DN634_c1_g1_i1:122-1042(-)
MSLTSGNSTPSTIFGSEHLKVKNTFIEFSDCEDEDEKRPPMAAVKSEPARSSSLPSADDEPRFSEDEDEDDASLRNYFAQVRQMSEENKSLRHDFAQKQQMTQVNQHAQPKQQQQPSLSPSASPICLLGRERLGNAYHANIKVKNTFIDVDSDDEDDCDRPPMSAVKSEPVVSVCNLSSPLKLEGKSFWGLRDTYQPLLPTSTEVDQENSEEEEEQTSGIVTQIIVPLQDRQPEISEGSQLHESGQCKPCAWFWRPQGCFNYDACTHCHLCLPGELKKLKKAKMLAFRARGQHVEQPAFVPSNFQA